MRLRRASRTLVATDFDGTLAPIVAQPEAAAPLDGAVAVLTRLAARRDCRVAIVSGRALSDVRARCPVEGCWYIGGHGNETSPGNGPLEAASTPDDLAPPPGPPHAQQIRRGLEGIAAELRRRAEAWPGTRLEAKPFSLALHFRQAPQWAEAIHAAFSAYAAHGDFRVLLGRQVIELLPSQALTKGAAVARLRRRLGCDLAFYFGDDTTDEDVFRLPDPALIGVKVEHRERSLPTAARFAVASPVHVVQALREIAELRQQQTTGSAGGGTNTKKILHNSANQP